MIDSILNFLVNFSYINKIPLILLYKYNYTIIFYLSPNFKHSGWVSVSLQE